MSINYVFDWNKIKIYTIQEQPHQYLHSPLAKLICLYGTAKLLTAM